MIIIRLTARGSRYRLREIFTDLWSCCVEGVKWIFGFLDGAVYLAKKKMEKKNKVFIATSIDGFIADAAGAIDWLHDIPNPDNDDMGYLEFISGIDAIMMGRSTFEAVVGFDIEWPFEKPVFVLSNSLSEVPKKVKTKNVQIVNGALTDVLKLAHDQGFYVIYVDGGKTIQGFLHEDLIDEMTITIIPVILGGGTKLFSGGTRLDFACTQTKMFLDKIVQNKFSRVR